MKRRESPRSDAANVEMTVPRETEAALSDTRRIPDFGYECPTAADAIASLARVLDGPRATELWYDVCARAGVHRPFNAHVEDLERASAELIHRGGAVGIVGTAFRIRLRTFRRLTARAAGMLAEPPGARVPPTSTDPSP